MSIGSVLEVTTLGQEPMRAAAGSLLTTDGALDSIVDSTTTAGYVYFCDAVVGTATSAAAWRISRINTSTGVTRFASGSQGLFNQVADNRASLTYGN